MRLAIAGAAPAILARLVLLLALPATAVAGEDVITNRVMTLELATDIAQGAVAACRKAGYQVSAVVVDRSGYPRVVLRDVLASRFTLPLATDKANAAILSGVPSGELRSNRGDIRAELNQVDGILVLAGGLPIRAAGSLLGAVGVSGAPGGERDEACAAAGLEAVQERLDFVE